MILRVLIQGKEISKFLLRRGTGSSVLTITVGLVNYRLLFLSKADSTSGDYGDEYFRRFWTLETSVFWRKRVLVKLENDGVVGECRLIFEQRNF